MRVTNDMMRKNLIYSMNERMEHLAKLNNQIYSTKKISRPSDDPIVATRILKFRTTLSEIIQYKANGEAARNWVSMTEGAMEKTRAVYKEMYDKSIQASNDVLNFDNRRAIASEFKELKEQIATQANASYAGRYIFSGFKTDRSVMFEERQNFTVPYQITETISAKDVQKIEKAFNHTTNEVYRIRLGYGNIDNLNLTPPLAPAPTVTTSEAAGAYDASTGPKFLKDTGELILPKAMAETLVQTTVQYEKKEFAKGDIRPEIYFNATAPDGTVFALKEENIEYQISYNQKFVVNLRAKDVFQVKMRRDIDEIIRETERLAKKEEELTEDDKISLKLLGQRYRNFAADMQKHSDHLSNEIALIGAKESRLMLTVNRLDDDELNFKQLLSDTEDTNIPAAMTELASADAAYSMALAAGAKIIQPTLLDFLR
ncbi:flagellar hook-associated protein 3 [Clostridiales bacterium COT073_COT-073]|nr:flagellar hook-associated protein 3 [Clostridiales bacterium COT073_COT-073]